MTEPSTTAGSSNAHAKPKILMPPDCVRGMRYLNRKLFQSSVLVPMLALQMKLMKTFLPLVKPYILKMPALQAVHASEQHADMREVLLNPLKIDNWQSIPSAWITTCQLQESAFSYKTVTLKYENWNANDIFKAVLPSNAEALSSYSLIGHVVHLNLREHLLPYKALIGEVLLDKVPNCRTVVNKVQSIDNVFRVFDFELLAGVPDYVVQVKEHNNVFKFDFSKVYWNPRLGTEHERIANIVKPNDVFFDVFAGVGPFAVPIARKGCTTYANDLNPDSYKWLQHNTSKIKAKNVHCYNLDGREFITTVIKQQMLSRWSKQPILDYDLIICMNLPAISLQFLDAFRGLFKAEQDKLNFNAPDFKLPYIFCYTFAVGQGPEVKPLIKRNVEYCIGLALTDDVLTSIELVRNVAPNKNMYRVKIYLNEEILTTTEIDKKLETAMPIQDANTLEYCDRYKNKRSACDNDKSQPKNMRI